MINRTYLVRMHYFQAEYPNVDIILSLPGSKNAPVLNPAWFVGVQGYTAAPAAWNAASGVNYYYELGGRAVRVERLVGTPGFTPRLNLGFHLSVVPLQNPETMAPVVPRVALSSSLVSFNTDPVIPKPDVLPDPAYGPVIRIYNNTDWGDQAGKVFLVNFSIFEDRDRDFSSLGR